jgi:hypothetical protein
MQGECGSIGGLQCSLFGGEDLSGSAPGGSKWLVGRLLITLAEMVAKNLEISATWARAAVFFA